MNGKHCKTNSEEVLNGEISLPNPNLWISRENCSINFLLNEFNAFLNDLDDLLQIKTQTKGNLSDFCKINIALSILISLNYPVAFTNSTPLTTKFWSI